MTGYDPRADLIAGLRDMADFLETNPDIPTPDSLPVLHYFPDGETDADKRDGVDKIAAYLGSSIDFGSVKYGHYVTGIAFGPVRYQAVAITTEARARYDAFNTYAYSVTPDPIDPSGPAGDSARIA